MKIRVIGSNMDVGQALTSHVEEELEKSVTKYFDKALSADVHFSKNGPNFKVVVTVNEGVKGGITVKSNSEAGDVYACFSEACTKAEKQLRRYKRKIKNYRRQGWGIKEIEPANYNDLDAVKYIIPPVIETDNDNETNNEQQEAESLNIITEKTTNVQELEVSEAIMKMDLADLPALVFINKETKRLNVVYHRKDGNISWIDPKI